MFILRYGKQPLSFIPQSHPLYKFLYTLSFIFHSSFFIFHPTSYILHSSSYILHSSFFLFYPSFLHLLIINVINNPVSVLFAPNPFISLFASIKYFLQKMFYYLFFTLSAVICIRPSYNLSFIL